MSGLTRWLVVGGGTAGCVVASRLSEDTSNEVVLLEAGPDHGPGQVADRGGVFITDPARLQPYAGVVRQRGEGPTSYPQGLGLGGTSLISGLIASPDPELFPYPHLMPLEQTERLGTLGGAVLAADRRARPALMTRRDGQRVTVADMYLRPVLHRTNLMVVTGSPVVDLGFVGWRADRAITADGIEYKADRIVLCAGAIGTPTLLLRSRIDTPGIGVGLQDHPACAITVAIAPGADVEAPVLSVVVDRVTSQILPLNHLPQAPGYGALVAGLLSVSSVGQVSLPDRNGQPLVELNQLSTDADIDGLREAVAGALDLLETSAVGDVVRAAFLDAHGTPVSELGDDREHLREWVVGNVTGFHHLTSSCREGVVTDPWGGVLGYEGLFICDASVFPHAPLRNPYLPIVQLAERMTTDWRHN